MNKDINYLKHIDEYIERIQKSTNKITKNNFENDEDLQDSCLRRIEVIGEAVKNISNSLKKKYPEIEWAKIAGTRDIIIHAYFSVDLDLVWDIIKRDIPLLKKQITKILKDTEF